MYIRLIIAICTFIYAVSLSTIANAQTNEFPPDDWMGGAESDWLVDVPAWDTLNVRSMPSHKAKKIGALKPGTIVGIDDRAENGWVYIYSGSIGGWVNSKFLCEASMSRCSNLQSDTSHDSSEPAFQEPAPRVSISVPIISTTTTTKTSAFPSDMNSVDDTVLGNIDAWASTQNAPSKWLQYDNFYLYEIPKTMNSPQMTVLSLSYSRSDMALLVQELFGFVDIAARIIEDHPDWTYDDVSMEVKSKQLQGMYSGQDKLIEYLTENKMTLGLLREREQMLDKKMNDCLEHIDQMRPTIRPTNPAQKCTAYIITK